MTPGSKDRFIFDDVHLTRGLAAGLSAVGSAEGTVESYHRQLDARSSLGIDPESVGPRPHDTCVVIVVEVGDAAAVVDALAHIERLPHRHSRLDAFTNDGRTFLDLVTRGASASVAGTEQLPGAAAAGLIRRQAPGLELRVMAPAAEAVLDGATVTLSDMQTRLLLALVVSHPSPLNIEQVSDLLWPDESLPATRHRLNNLVFRLRQALGPHGAALVRTGDLLQLDGDRCEVDHWRFRQALTGDVGERRHALMSVRGNLCDAQFPYEERFVDERHRLCGEWLRHAREAVQAGEVDPADLDTALVALKLAPSDLERPGTGTRDSLGRR